MKIQIRKSVFETNSSSTHALCLGKGYKITQDVLNFGVILSKDYWSAKQDYQYRADTLFAGIISKYEYNDTKPFVRLGKLINILNKLNITYTFNFDEDYIENNLPYVEETEWVDNVLESEDNFLRYIFNDYSEYIVMDRDELYFKGGWESIMDKNKVDIYE